MINWIRRVVGPFLRRYALLLAGLSIYLLFFLSVLFTGWLDLFFSGPALHVGARGIDFLQIPQGAWSFFHGGSLDGSYGLHGANYAGTAHINGNVYHPLFTLALGSLLTRFSPDTAWLLWLGIKFVLSLIAIVLFYDQFRSSPYVFWGIFLLTANASIYLELAAGQYQFLVNLTLLLMLIAIAKGWSCWWSGLFYGLSLLVKPIGLLFVPVLLLKRQWRTALIGLLFYGACTLYTWPIGQYYVDGLLANIMHPWNPGPNQIMTLYALLYSLLKMPTGVTTLLRGGVLVLLLLLCVWRRIDLNRAIFLLVAYFLCFYNQAYEYDWSMLAYVAAICVVCSPAFQTRLARLGLLLICLPSCFVLLKLWHIDVVFDSYYGELPGLLAWRLMVTSKVIPLFLLTGSVLAPEAVLLWRRLPAYYAALRARLKRTEIVESEAG